MQEEIPYFLNAVRLWPCVNTVTAVEKNYSWNKIIFSTLIFLLVFITLAAQPAKLEGNWNNGAWSNTTSMADRGAVLWARVQVAGSANRDFLFNNSTWSYNPQWTGSTVNYIRTTDNRLPGAAYYYTGGGWNQNLRFAANDGYYYTFISGKNSAANNDLAILSTPYHPRDITAVDPAPAVVSPGQTVNIQVTLSGALQGAGAIAENAWLRYTTDNWATSSFIAMGSLNALFQGTATIPAAANTAGVTIQYYALTTGNNTTPTHADADYQSLNTRNAAGQNVSGANFSYTVASGWTSAANGNWSNAATWASGAVPPTSGNLGVISINHNVALDQNATITTLNLGAGTFTASGANTLTVTGTATIGNGAVFTNSSSNASNISITNFVVSNGGTYNHDAVGSSANGASSDFPGSSSRTFGATSSVVITKWAQPGGIPVPLPASSSPGWGNLTIAIDNSITYAAAVSPYNQSWNQNGNMTNIQGNLNISRTGTASPNEFRFFGQASNASLTILGNVNISGGRVAMIGDGFGSNKTVTIRVKGDFTLSGSATFDLTSSYANLGGFHYTYLYLEGNLLIQNSAKFQRYRTNTTNGIAFVKPSGVQTFNSHANGLNTGNPGVGFRVGDGTTTNTLQLQTSFLSLQTVTSTFPNLGNWLEVYNKATLECPGENYMQGWGFTTDAGSTLLLGSKDGIESVSASAKGNVRMISTVYGTMYHPGAHYIYTGAYNQVTGNGLPATITGSLGITNTGAVNDNIVTLTTNNTETKTLNLNSGYFAAGTGQTLKISNNGTINGTANGDCVYATSNGGNIHLLGNNAVSGSSADRPHFYDVTIGSGIANSPVTFTNNGTIYHYCTINNQGSVNPAAPGYATGSTLIYNSGGTYNRNIEWGNTSGLPGYPWHVTVQNNTTLDLNTNAIAPAALELGGDLTIGNAMGKGSVYMNNNMAKPLVVLGNLSIGSGGASASNSELGLSSAFGGDLHLYGDFSRYSNSFYTDNGRAIYFKGTANASISTPGVYITPGVPTQFFSYARIDKSVGTENILLNCPVGIAQEISFIKGIVSSTATNLLLVSSGNPAAASGGSDLSFVNGPLSRVVNTTGDYGFPVGKTGTPNKWRPISVVPASTVSGTFWAEYFKGPTPNNGTLLSSISSLENNEYWQVDRPAGTTDAVIKLDYKNPGSGINNWTPIDPCGICEVAVAQYNTGGSGYWELTKNVTDLDAGVPETRPYTSNGNLYSASLSNFSLSRPFTAAAYFQIVLPVKLLRFAAVVSNGDGVLSWDVEGQEDISRFELQVSPDGKKFSKLVQLPATAGGSYSYRDPKLAAGLHYYRLGIITKTGQITYSPVVILPMGKFVTRITGLAENPVSSQVTSIIFSATVQTLEAFISDASGRICNRFRGQLKAGQNLWAVPFERYARGLYFITIVTGDGQKATFRFIKNH